MASKAKPTTTTTTTKSKEEEAEQQPAEPKEAKGQKMKEKKGEAKAEGTSAARIKAAIDSVLAKAESGKLPTPKQKKEIKGKPSSKKEPTKKKEKRSKSPQRSSSESESEGEAKKAAKKGGMKMKATTNTMRVIVVTRNGQVEMDSTFQESDALVMPAAMTVLTNKPGRINTKETRQHLLLGGQGCDFKHPVEIFNHLPVNDDTGIFDWIIIVLLGILVVAAIAEVILDCVLLVHHRGISLQPGPHPLQHRQVPPAKPPAKRTGRKILLLAPGETMAQVSPTWFQLCVGEDGSYWQNNINFPAALHPRNEAIEGSYSNDPPLTNVGKAEGQLTGRAIQRNYIKVVQIFSAPDYASVETSHEVLLQLIDGEEGNGGEAMLRIKVEPALAKEPIDTTKAALVWLPAERFAEHGMPTVDSNYEPLDADELKAEDDVWGDQRIQQFVTNVIEAGTKGTVLIVAPPSTLMAVLRRLRGGWPTHRGDETRRWPSSGIVAMQKWSDNHWSTIPNVIPPLTLRRLTFDNIVELDATDSDIFA